MTVGRTIEIAAGKWRAGLRPEVGGALAFLSHADNDLLRAMPAGSQRAAEGGGFAMVPWAGPIRLGRFRFGGNAIKIPPNAPPSRHPVNGIGWQRPWVLDGLVGASAELVLDHGGGLGWPWPLRTRQAFALDEGGLTITLSLTNEGPEVMPAGLGYALSLRRWRDSRLRFTARKAVLADIEGIPTGEFAAADHFGDWRAGLAIPPTTVDNAWRDWDGELELADGLGRISLKTEGATTLRLFAPGTGRELTVIAANHLPDALTREDWAMPVLPPRETASLTLRIGEE
jgi:aldose 1-epimerase